MDDPLEISIQRAIALTNGQRDYGSIQRISHGVDLEIRKIPLYAKCKNPMFFKGGSSTTIRPDALATRAVLFGLDHGPKKAASFVRRITSMTELKVTCASLISGVTAHEIVDVGNGVKIYPLDRFQVPISQVNALNPIAQQSGAGVIVAAEEVLSPVILDCPLIGLPPAMGPYPTTATLTVSTVVHLLTLLGPSAAVNHGSWIQTLDADVEAILPTAGYGMTQHEVRPMGWKSATVTTEIGEICAQYEALSENSKKHIDVSIRRLNLACRRMNAPDMALDAAIALEAAMGGGNEKDEISYRLRMRSAWLIGGDLAERKLTANKVKRLYALRSRVVHSGQANVKIDDDSAVVGTDVTNLLIRKILEIGGFPDWSTVELTGGSELGVIS